MLHCPFVFFVCQETPSYRTRGGTCHPGRLFSSSLPVEICTYLHPKASRFRQDLGSIIKLCREPLLRSHAWIGTLPRELVRHPTKGTPRMVAGARQEQAAVLDSLHRYAFHPIELWYVETLCTASSPLSDEFEASLEYTAPKTVLPTGTTAQSVLPTHSQYSYHIIGLYLGGLCRCIGTPGGSRSRHPLASQPVLWCLFGQSVGREFYRLRSERTVTRSQISQGCLIETGLERGKMCVDAGRPSHLRVSPTLGNDSASSIAFRPI